MFIAGAGRWWHREPRPALPPRIGPLHSHTALPTPPGPALLQIRAGRCRWLPLRGRGWPLREPSVPWLWRQGDGSAIIRRREWLWDLPHVAAHLWRGAGIGGVVCVSTTVKLHVSGVPLRDLSLNSRSHLLHTVSGIGL